MHRIFATFIRTSSFLQKEILEILRQPRLILTLVLGPFLILLLFGIGYQNQARPLRTLFVVPEGNALRDAIEQQVANLGPQLLFAGITPSEAEAQRRLQENEVDVVAIVPPDAYQTIRNSEQAVFTLLHNEIDPLEAEYVRIFGQVYVDEVNRRVLRAVTQEGQRDAAMLENTLRRSRESAAGVRSALEAGDAVSASTRMADLRRDVSELELLVGGSIALLGGVQQVAGNPSQEQAELSALLTDVRQDTNALSDERISNGGDSLERAREIEDELALLETELAEFQKIDARVLIQPFHSETRSIAPVQLRVSDFYAPSVIVLLLQHFAVTFAGLSIVRERRAGTMELFRVAPLTAIETLLGKYAGYLLFIGVIALVLSLLLVFGLQVPMLGSWPIYALVLLSLTFTALGMGFAISLISQTTTQAVQYAMILLLASIFFTGFFLSLETLWAPVRILSWMLPATYGIQLLQNVMLRGAVADWSLIGNLSLIGVNLFLVAWLLLRFRMARE